MKNPRSFKAEKRVTLYRLARFHRANGDSFDIRVTDGCEIFVGRFTRLAELDHKDGLIRFREPAFF